MSATNRGIRNAFRNRTRTFSVILILGLSIGLSLAMLLAHQAVGQKINNVKGTVGNSISISPAGFSNFSQANNALTTSQLDKVKGLAHISTVSESLTDRLTTIGSSQPEFGGQTSNSNNQTSLNSPITLNSNGNGGFSGGNGGGHLFISGGGNLPANFSPPITIVGTTDPGSLDGSPLKITSGKNIDGSKDTSGALISKDMASKNNLKAGSTFTAYGATLTVSGIFDSGTRAGNDQVIVSLPALQRLSGQSGVVTTASATVDSVDNLASATSAIKNTLGSTADVTNDQSRIQDTVDSLKNIRNISLYSLIGAVIAGAVIIFLTMLMIVRERRTEIGVTKAIGASNAKIMWQFMAEAVTLTVLAAVVGIIIGVVAADPITKTLVNNANSGNSQTANQAGAAPFTQRFNGGGPVSIGGGAIPGNRTGFVPRGRGLGTIKSNITNIHAAVGWSILAYGLAAALGIALIGSALASWSIAKVRPAEVMRAE